MSLETFQMAQRIILSFNPITKSLGKLNCANIYQQCETEPTVDLKLDFMIFPIASPAKLTLFFQGTSHFYVAGL